MNPVIILGAGLAGYTLAREFRKLDKTTPLTIITADSGDFYSKPMLSNAFAQKKAAPQLISQRVDQMALQLDATILARTEVLAIDDTTRTVRTATTEFSYEKLVLAVGAMPIRLQIAGDAAQDVLAVNHLDHYAQFRSMVGLPAHGPATRIAILGAGLIGCEFADDLANAGHHVTLIDPNSRPLAALASPALAHGLQLALEGRGVSLRLGTTAASIDHVPGGRRVSLADGSSIEVDLVLSAVGLRANCALAASAGCDVGRGVQIDRFGRTSCEHIFALGDCAEYLLDSAGQRQTLPYIAPLMTSARALARSLAGTPTVIELAAAPVMVKTPSYPLALLPPAASSVAAGRWIDTTDGTRTISRYVDASDTMTGFGVAPHDAAVRQQLLAELGSTLPLKNGALTPS